MWQKAWNARALSADEITWTLENALDCDDTVGLVGTSHAQCARGYFEWRFSDTPIQSGAPRILLQKAVSSGWDALRNMKFEAEAHFPRNRADHLLSFCVLLSEFENTPVSTELSRQALEDANNRASMVGFNGRNWTPGEKAALVAAMELAMLGGNDSAVKDLLLKKIPLTGPLIVERVRMLKTAVGLRIGHEENDYEGYLAAFNIVRAPYGSVPVPYVTTSYYKEIMGAFIQSRKPNWSGKIDWDDVVAAIRT
jgi:hypothetical protein